MNISLVGKQAELDDKIEDHLIERRNAESLRKKNRILKDSMKTLTDKINSYDSKYSIVIPETTSKRTEQLISMCDEFTIKTIVNYLDLDNYELIKNMAAVTNSSNAAEVLAHRDGGLARNFALKDILLTNVKKKISFVDKMEGKVKNEMKKPKKS